MGEYQHPLFFEAKELIDKEKEKIRRYFQKKRECGGGECGVIEKIRDGTYKICFREKEAQERVLQKKIHKILLPSGELHITVTRTNAAEPPEPTDSDSHTLSISPANTPLTPRDAQRLWGNALTRDQEVMLNRENTKRLEKIFKIDIYLLYYLRDNPHALSDVEKRLSAIGCKVELDFDEEEAVVRADVEKASPERWELQVDKVLIDLTETYLCYHVVEPKKVKTLLQDPSFVTDGVKVYTESGYAVMVGELRAVKERIAILEKRVPFRKELPVVEKQFQLVEEEFHRELCEHCPGVKISRGNVNLIVLEGAENQVQMGVTTLEELIKKVKEKSVKLSTALLSFMTSSGVISRYQARFQQSLRSPVALVVGTELALSSLSSDALDEAEAALVRDLTEVMVQLQGAAAQPPNLNKVKQILIEAKREENLRELRVDFNFLPGPSGRPTKVQLVGYSQHVNRLKEVLQDYQMNQVETQEVLNLPDPDMIDDLDQILAMIGMKLTEVTLKASNLPYPCVLVTGPRCRVQEAKQILIASLTSFIAETLVLDGPGAQRYFQMQGKVSMELLEKSHRVLIKEKPCAHSANVSPQSLRLSNSDLSRVSSSLRRSSIAGTSNKTNLEIKIGSLVDEQVNVLVAPMFNRKLTSTKIGSCLLRKAGNALKAKFDAAMAMGAPSPGDVLQVEATASLGCSKICFIECLEWDGVNGQSGQALGDGLQRCLDLCVQQRLDSVALPVMGPGIVLKYPLREAVGLLTETILQFGRSASSGLLSTIHIVISPDSLNAEECYHDVYRHLSLDMNQQATFRSLNSDLDDITIRAGGGLKLQLVFGDITNEITDAVVNTTDFLNFTDDGVCKDILTVAGPVVEDELKAASVKRGEVLVSQPGSFPCLAILHVCGEKDAGLIEQLVCRIVEHCEAFGFESVAIPAICAGVGGLEPGVVAGAILRGVQAAASSAPLNCLSVIRLVFIKMKVFLAFKEEAMQMFSTAMINRAPLHQLPHAQQQQPPLSLRPDLSVLRTGATGQRSIFLFRGLSRKDVSDAMTNLKNLYEAQCSTQTFEKTDLEALTQEDMMDLKELVESLGLYMQTDEGGVMVSGLKDGVSQVTQMINTFHCDNLRRKVRAREEEDLYGHVAWCILGHNSNWERLPKTANYDLEMNEVAGGIVDAQGVQWSADRQKMEATRPSGGQVAQLKRLRNLPDFSPPLYWDDMSDDQTLEVVALQPSSAEYHRVKEAFKRTAARTVMKIERLQNVHLRRAYEVQKKNMSDRKVQARGAQEQLLYHGTTPDNCDSIIKTGFNRRFSGQNATAYGHGTYFAVHASYSANPVYSKPAADGSQLMFVARVLTGTFTLGHKDMRVPPAVNELQPHERYDSVVDNTLNPNMYVVFHDNQAYPDYLITFK